VPDLRDVVGFWSKADLSPDRQQVSFGPMADLAAAIA